MPLMYVQNIYLHSLKKENNSYDKYVTKKGCQTAIIEINGGAAALCTSSHFGQAEPHQPISEAGHGACRCLREALNLLLQPNQGSASETAGCRRGDGRLNQLESSRRPINHPINLLMDREERLT